MLPVLQAINITGFLEGGSTRPLKVIVLKNGLPCAFAVKIYKKKHIDQSFSVAKDVYASILAKELGMDTPVPALIDFNKDFIKELDEPYMNELKDADTRLKFGTELIDGAFQFLETLHREGLKKYEIESIYAFDNLIKNTDRKTEKGKSNILMKGTNAYLIDHELTFEGLQQAIIDFPNGKWVYWKEGHIFYSFLKHGHNHEKMNYFKDFFHSLNNVNLDVLDKYSEQLIELGHHTGEKYQLIKEYLCKIQKDSEKFINLVRQELLR
jgi:hypothetical protein